MVLLVVCAALACRQREPNGNPKMPPYAPQSDIERKDDEPKTDPTPDTGDAS
jgi:hypothetical protein